MSTISIHAHGPRLAAAGPRGTRPAAGGVRLTRRGRLVVLLAALVLLASAALFLGATSVATDQPGTPPPHEAVTVDSGQTLWGIAAEVTPADADVRETVTEIKQLNALDTVVLDAGQELMVPVGD